MSNSANSENESLPPPLRRVTWRNEDQRQALQEATEAAFDQIETELLDRSSKIQQDERALAHLKLGQSCLETISPLLNFKYVQKGNYIFRRQENQLPVATKFVASLSQIMKSICINQRGVVSQDTLDTISRLIQVIQSTRID